MVVQNNMSAGKATAKKFEVFSKENLGPVRVAFATKDGEPWFVAKDVCDCLGINNPRQALTRLEADEKNTVILNDGIKKRGNPNLSVVSESGLYTLIMSARKKEAVAFQKWVTREVLPSIRRHGAYVMGQEDMTSIERESLLIAVEKLAKEKGFFETDGNYWFERYNALLQDYQEVSEALVQAKKYLRKENGGIVPASEPEKEDEFLLREERGKDGVWTDKQMFIENVKTGSIYSIVEREMR